MFLAHSADCVDAETIVRCMPALETQHIATAESMVRRSRTFDSGLLQLGTRVPCDREFMRAKRPAGTAQVSHAPIRPQAFPCLLLSPRSFDMQDSWSGRYLGLSGPSNFDAFERAVIPAPAPQSVDEAASQCVGSTASSPSLNPQRCAAAPATMPSPSPRSAGSPRTGHSSRAAQLP